MKKINLHLTNYDRVGENRSVLSRSVELEEIPNQNQYLIISDGINTRFYLVTNTYVPVGFSDGISAHVFATRASPPYQEAKKVGIAGDELGMPSLTSFDGRTVADLIAFFSEYPSDMEVIFENHDVLVAKPKDVLILRLDPKEEHQ